jgi:hypothetical protein
VKTFFLGAHHPGWLERTSVPLFVSRASFYKDGKLRKSFPRAKGPWALDSGGFSQIKAHGRWTISAEQYVEDVQVFMREVGKLQFAAAQDWMCEGEQLVRTGLKVADHQRLTIDNYLELKDLAPRLPWVPVLQGWTFGDYMDHVAAYEKAGVDLAKLPLVGLGSVCRRQDTVRVGFLIQDLASQGIKIHGFGFKTDGLLFKPVRDALTSADSMSWSLQARFSRGHCCGRPAPGHPAKCTNCLDWAVEWRDDLLQRIDADDAAYREAVRREKTR